MAAFFTWNDSYNTGIREIDTQHKRLVELINALYDAMSKGQAQQLLTPILNELVKYTVSHFSAEERLMVKAGYPDYAAHKKVHEEFTAKVLAMQKDCAAGKLSLTLNLANFLKDWLKGHIMGSDQKYVPHLASKGMR